MSNYTKATNFATKDTLPTGDSGKIVKGTELDNEFNAIASAISSKADTASPTFTGTPAAPTATSGSNTTQIATTAYVKGEIDALDIFVAGMIIIWSGSSASIPTGWVICDGTNFYNANTVQAGGTTISLIDGTAVNPSLNFLSEPTTGLYRPAGGHLGISILGTQKVDIDATTLDATSLDIQTTGTGNFESGILGGKIGRAHV